MNIRVLLLLALSLRGHGVVLYRRGDHGQLMQLRVVDEPSAEDRWCRKMVVSKIRTRSGILCPPFSPVWENQSPIF